MQDTKPAADLLKYERYIRPLHEDPIREAAMFAVAGVVTSIGLITLGICLGGAFSIELPTIFGVTLLGSAGYLCHYRDSRYTPQTDCSCSRCSSCVLPEKYETVEQRADAAEEVMALRRAKNRLEAILDDRVRPDSFTRTRDECHQYLKKAGVQDLLQGEIIPNFGYCVDPDGVRLVPNIHEMPKSISGYCEIMGIMRDYRDSILSRIRSIQKAVHVRSQEACSAIPGDMKIEILKKREEQRRPLFTPVSA